MKRLACALLLTSVSLSTAAQYTVASDTRRPTDLVVNLKLPAGDGQPRKLVARGTAWGLESQVGAPRCGKTLLRRDNDGMWIAPGSCREVTWNVHPKKVRDGIADVSEQASLFFRQQGWTLLSEPTSLLRLEGDLLPSTLSIATQSGRHALLGATSVGETIWRVPSTNNAPEFFVVGKVNARTRNVGPFHVRYVADDLTRVERLALEAVHERALRYLARVLPPPATLPASERALLVVWVGIHEGSGRAGGSAGSRSFVANYVFGKRDSEPVNAARTLMVLAHEQFHQLADMVKGDLAPRPVWLGESLAQYYGLKALAEASPGPAAESVRARFIDPSRAVTAGLVELDRRHAAKDPSAYPLFYEQGATFWAAIDEALRRSSDDAHGLDALIPDLLRSSIEGRSLPTEFVARLRSSIGTRADELLATYVGT